MAMRRTPSVSTRQRLGEWGIVAALLLAALRFGPTWLPISNMAAPKEVAVIDETPPQYAWVVVPVRNNEPISDAPPPAVAEAPSEAPAAPVYQSLIGWVDALVVTYLALTA